MFRAFGAHCHELTCRFVTRLGSARNDGARRLTVVTLPDLLQAFATRVSARSGHMPATSLVVIIGLGRPLKHGARPGRIRIRTADGHPGLNSLPRSNAQQPGVSCRNA
jgi:hypothetical protein